MPDGRRTTPARVAALTITTLITLITLTTVGLGLATTSPAAAAPTSESSLDSARARVDRLSRLADTAEGRHQVAQSSLRKQRTRVRTLTAGVQRHQRLIDSLRTQVVSAVVDQYGGGGASVLPTALPPASEQLLTNVTVVSEDTGGRTEAMAASGVRVQRLAKQRSSTRARVAGLRRTETVLGARESRADARLATASNVLRGLEERAAARRAQRAAAQQADQQTEQSGKVSSGAGAVVAFAKAQVGKSYVYGASGPDSFDCSGLTTMAWKQAGVSLPRVSTAQYSAGTRVSESELQPGDLVFYYTPISHVGVYIGDGQVVNALNPGSGVQVSGLKDMPYVGAVRPG